MPADGIPRRPSTWNGDIGTSRLEEQLERRLYDPRLIQKTSYSPRRRTTIRPKSLTLLSESGQKRRLASQPITSGPSQWADHFQSPPGLRIRANTGHPVPPREPAPDQGRSAL